MKKFILILGLLGLLIASPSFAFQSYTGTATLTFATDNNTTSAVSVPRECKVGIAVMTPTIESSTIAAHVSLDGVTYAPLFYNAGAAAAPAAWLVGATTAAAAIEVPRAALAYQYIRFEFGTGQTANRTLKVTCN